MGDDHVLRVGVDLPPFAAATEAGAANVMIASMALNGARTSRRPAR